MKRLLFPMLIIGAPALAHTGTSIHLHQTDYAAVGLGVALIAAGALAAYVVRQR